MIPTRQRKISHHPIRKPAIPIPVYISAGSNVGDRGENLRYALSELERGGTVALTSSFYETEPVGYADQPWFLNVAIGIQTRLTAAELLDLCMGIEESRGRERTFPNAPRTLDLDILFYGNAVIREEDLIIPHPRLAGRRFVLEPMAQIAPDLVHPLLQKTIRTLLDECTDTSRVRLYS
jgi:2-amino-4-hydroxy-6-hydroxymethyldihydropteridine diphosphokinase